MRKWQGRSLTIRRTLIFLPFCSVGRTKRSAVAFVSIPIAFSDGGDDDDSGNNEDDERNTTFRATNRHFSVARWWCKRLVPRWHLPPLNCSSKKQAAGVQPALCHPTTAQRCGCSSVSKVAHWCVFPTAAEAEDDYWLLAKHHHCLLSGSTINSVPCADDVCCVDPGWKPFETPNGKILVAASDTTVGCSGGIRKRVTAWLELILLELGARCAAQSVRLLAQVTCEGSTSAARMIVHFPTGSHRMSTWFWECVVLQRKLLLVICATLLCSGLGGVLASVGLGFLRTSR